jgi:hypothetical protein
MRTIVVLLVLLLALSVVDSYAQWFDPKTGGRLQDNDWRKASGDLGAMIIMTNNAESFFYEWENTAAAHIPQVKTTSQVRRGEVIAALLFFSGCGAEGDSCNAVVDFKVMKPDGSVYGDNPGNKVLAWPAPKKGVVLLSQAHLQIRIEPNDPIGAYPVIAVLREPNTGKVIRLKQQFEVVP